MTDAHDTPPTPPSPNRVFALTPEEQAKIALGLKLLAVRQRRLRYGDPATTDELKSRFQPDWTYDCETGYREVAPETQENREAPPQKEDGA